MFVLKAQPYCGQGTRFSDGYYTGDTYIFHGEKYAVVEKDITKAKKYTSLKRAERAAESLFNSISNYIFDVKEFKE